MSRSKKRKFTSPSQAAAARANGAQSTGATTPEGKARLGGNRLVHGFRATSVSLVNEDASAYTDHLDQYLKRYNPIDKTEHDLVGLCAVNMWHLMRITSIETALFDLEICGLEDELRRDYTNMDEWGRLALAFAFKNTAGDHILRQYD